MSWCENSLRGFFLSRRIAVVGGGIAGLTAAFRACNAGHSVTLYEPGPLGGLIRSRRVNEHLCECGPNVILSKPSMMALIEAVGLSDNVVRPSVMPYRQYVWYKGKPSAVPKSPGLLLGTDLVPLTDKLLLPLRAFKKRHVFSSLEDESIADFLARIVGRSAVSRMIAPALRGIVGGDVTQLSARSFFPDLYRTVRSGGSFVDYLRSRRGVARAEVFTLKDGIESLIQALIKTMAGKVAIRKDSVCSVEQRMPGGGFNVQMENGGLEYFDEVALSVPARQTLEMVSALSPELARLLAGVNSVSLAALHFSVDAAVSLPERGFGVLFPKEESLEMCGVMFNSVLFPHVAPPGKHVLTVVAAGSAVVEKPDEVLGNEGQQWLKQRFGIPQSDFLGCAKWPMAIPQYRVGHWKVVEAIEAVEKKFPGIHFLGSYRGGVGVPDRVSVSEGRW